MQPKPKFIKAGIALFFVLLSAVIIHSCKKDLSQSEQSQTQITDAKTWYQSTYHTAQAGALKNMNTAGAVTNGDFSQIVKPDWNKANTYSRLGSDVVELPLDDAVTLGFNFQNSTANQFNFNKSLSHTSFLILHNTAGYKAYLMTIIADSAYVGNDYDKLSGLSYKSLGKGFSGYVLYFLPEGKLVNGFKYIDGHIVKAIASNVSTGLQVQNSNKLKTNNECSTISFVVYIGTICGGEGVHEHCTYHYDRYTITVCSTEPRLDGDGGPPNPQTGGGGEGGGGGDPVVTVEPIEIPPYVSSVINNVTDQCMASTVNQMTGANLTNKLQSLLWDTFGSQGKIALSIGQTDTIASNGRLGFTQPNPTISTNLAGDSLYSFNVFLNANVLPNAAKEITAITILHEALHAYYQFAQINMNNALRQHTKMAQDYMTSMREAVQSFYPISDRNANALILGEFADLKQNFPQDYEAVANTFNLTTIDIGTIISAYKAGTSGTKCN